jgi:hypothetical protein
LNKDGRHEKTLEANWKKTIAAEHKREMYLNKKEEETDHRVADLNRDI